MGNIQLKATLVANTGTGKLFTPYRFLGDTAKYVEDGAVGVPATITMKATEPKPTKTYAGAARGEMKYTESWTDAAGQSWPVVITSTSSIPAGMPAADKVAFVTRALIALQEPEGQALLAKNLVPQT